MEEEEKNKKKIEEKKNKKMEEEKNKKMEEKNTKSKEEEEEEEVTVLFSTPDILITTDHTKFTSTLIPHNANTVHTHTSDKCLHQLSASSPPPPQNQAGL